ncbi:MAG: metallophosphoesterase [Clostridiales bacterium]|nr:metallophosphoesterase [Clostridiales bacterium]
MTYLISSLYGQYEAFIKLMDKINLKGTDNLYLLGDVADIGPQPIKLLQDLACRANVYPILGEHDYFAYKMLSKFMDMPADGDVMKYLSPSEEEMFDEWMSMGGNITLKQFLQLDEFDREDIIDYLSEFSIYEETTVDGVNYVMVHAGIKDFSPDKDMDDYSFDQIIFEPADYSKVYFADKVLVTAHTPVADLGHSEKSLFYKENNHICVNLIPDNKIAAIRLNDGKEYTINF